MSHDKPSFFKQEEKPSTLKVLSSIVILSLFAMTWIVLTAYGLVFLMGGNE